MRIMYIISRVSFNIFFYSLGKLFLSLNAVLRVMFTLVCFLGNKWDLDCVYIHCTINQFQHLTLFPRQGVNERERRGERGKERQREKEREKEIERQLGEEGERVLKRDIEKERRRKGEEGREKEREGGRERKREKEGERGIKGDKERKREREIDFNLPFYLLP